MHRLTFWSPTNYIYSLVMLGQGRKIFDFSLRPIRLNLPNSNVVITTGSSKTTLATWLEVYRVDRSVLVVPIDDERRGLHRGAMLGLCMEKLCVLNVPISGCVVAGQEL